MTGNHPGSTVASPTREGCVTPYTEKQRKFFNAADHNPQIAREHGITHGEAHKLADEANRLKKQGREKKASFIDLEPVFYDGHMSWR